jgi:hypothetical protein
MLSSAPASCVLLITLRKSPSRTCWKVLMARRAAFWFCGTSSQGTTHRPGSGRTATRPTPPDLTEKKTAPALSGGCFRCLSCCLTSCCRLHPW